MKTAGALLLACVLVLPSCRQEDAAPTDTANTATSIAQPVAPNPDGPIEAAHRQISEAMIRERDTARRGLLARIAIVPGPTPEWKEFRRAFPYHIQEIAVSQRHGNERTVIVAEPPPFVSLEDLLEAAGPNLVSYELQKNPIGYDGWVKDVVLHVSGEDGAISNTVSRLTYAIYGTTYKAHVLPLPAHPMRRSLDIDLDVTPAEIQQWLMTDSEGFIPVLGGPPMSVDEIFVTPKARVFFSDRRGLVAWWIPTGVRVDTLQPEIRQFALDSDLIIGAVHRTGGTLILARERGVPVDDLPPLRYETIAMLAGVGGDARDELKQSYERRAPFAGAIGDRWDWAPILLSPELVDTEYGSLLNITDQLLKGWSNHGDTVYKRFENYPKPRKYPFPGRLPDILLTDDRGGALTYNWNTTGVGYGVAAGDSEIYALYRTGALPVSYIPDGAKRTDLQVMNAEDAGYEFFAGVRDPNLVRVVQYAALYQVFTAFDVHANAAPVNEHPHELRETIEGELTAELRSASDEERNKLANDLALRIAHHTVERINDGANDIDYEAMAIERLPGVLSDLEQVRLGTIPPMSKALSTFAELRKVPERYKKDGDTSNVWIHTPLVVLSKNLGKPKETDRGYRVLVGGHNLYAERTRFETSTDVPVGEPRITSKGVEVNPRDEAKVRDVLRVTARDRRAEMKPDEIAADLAATMRRLPEPRPPRSQLVALKLDGDGPAKPPHPPFRGRGTGDHGGSNGWEMSFGHDGGREDGLLPGAVLVERRKDRTIHIVFEGGEVHAATAEDATDAVAQLLKYGKIGENGVRLELRGFEAGEDAHNFVRSCNLRSGAADAEVSALIADGRMDAATAAEIRARQYDFSNARARSGDLVLHDGRLHSTIVVDIPRKGVGGAARTDVTVAFHGETPQPIAQTLLGRINAAIERIGKEQAAKLDALVFNMRINREIKSISRKTGVPIEIVRQQFIDARHDLYFVELSYPAHFGEGEDERRHAS